MHAFRELPSTQDYAAQLVSKSAPPEGVVVLADNQTAGRGQYGSRWYSAPGENLLLTIVLYPRWLEVTRQWALSEAMAVAVRDAVEAVARLHAHIKWPNDVYLSERKVAGLLIQCGLSGEHLQHALIGIGLNVNQRHFPAEAPRATSLALACGRHFDRSAVLEQLLTAVEQRYVQLRQGQGALLSQIYRQHLLGLDQRRIFGRSDGSTFEGTAKEILPDGRLVIQTEEGDLAFGVKELRWIDI